MSVDPGAGPTTNTRKIAGHTTADSERAKLAGVCALCGLPEERHPFYNQPEEVCEYHRKLPINVRAALLAEPEREPDGVCIGSTKYNGKDCIVVEPVDSTTDVPKPIGTKVYIGGDGVRYGGRPPSTSADESEEEA